MLMFNEQCLANVENYSTYKTHCLHIIQDIIRRHNYLDYIINYPFFFIINPGEKIKNLKIAIHQNKL